jgi:ABC-2 type transport system permease protein
MSIQKIRTIISKEWSEVFKNRLVLFTVAFLPLIFLALPIITLVITQGFAGEATSAMNSQDMEFFGELCMGLEEMDCASLYMLNLYTLMFMMIPVIVPVTIAAYSIVGEKTSRSLEPLLATPITTTELLLGKILAACIPAVLITWIAFLLYVLSAWLLVSAEVFALAMDPMWLIAIFVVGPLMSLMAVSVAVMVSSRVTDPRAAEQLAAFVILPIILLILGQSMGWLIVDARLVLVLGLLVLLADVVLVYLSVKSFQRETILTKWK